jgi:hypothetical protein
MMELNQTAPLETYNKPTAKDRIPYFLSTAYFCTMHGLNHQLKPPAPLPFLAKSGNHIQ